MQIVISETKSEFVENNSNSSKNAEESSVTTSTKVPNSEGYGKHELKVIDGLLNNTFTKLSDFSDILGRKLVFTVDWEYMDRYVSK